MHDAALVPLATESGEKLCCGNWPEVGRWLPSGSHLGLNAAEANSKCCSSAQIAQSHSLLVSHNTYLRPIMAATVTTVGPSTDGSNSATSDGTLLLLALRDNKCMVPTSTRPVRIGMPKEAMA